MRVQTKAGYSATMGADGVLTVHRVPIFVECERGDVKFDAEWISAAVAKAKQAEAEGYLPPLHIRHHEAATEATNAVRASGFFRILGVEAIRFKGETRLAVVADLIVTDPATQQEILSKRLPYRSVEIFNVEKPAIDSLALLDHEAPFLELPMLMVAEVNRLGQEAAVPHATLQVSAGSTVAASFRRGARAALLFRTEDYAMADTEKNDGKGKDEKMAEGAKLDVSAIVKAIKDGSISVAEMDQILAAIEEAEGKSEHKEPDGDEGTAPTPTVPGASMKKDNEELSVQFAALKGELDGTKAEITALKAEKAKSEFVAAAMKRLDGCVLGAEFEPELAAFYSKHGAEAAAAYVESFSKRAVRAQGDDARGAMFAAQTGKGAQLSAAVLKFEKDGPSAVEKAAAFSAEWRALNGRGTRLSEEAYIAANMARVTAEAKGN